MLELLKRPALSLAALLLAAAPLAAQTDNPNARFGMPAPVEAKASSREAYLSTQS